MKQKRLRLALAANLLIVLLVVAAWIWSSLTPHEPGMLEGNWLTNLRFYTNLSNLLAGVTALCYALGLLRILRGKASCVSTRVQTLALVGTAAISLTFLTVACFLGPLYPQLHLFRNASFLFHALIPVLCIAVYLLLDHFGRPLRFGWLLGAAPMLLYGIAYIANCLINGIGQWPYTNDWYGFLNWGLPIGLVIFAVLCAVTAGTGALLQLINKKLAAKTLQTSK